MASYLTEGDLDEEQARRSIVVSNIPQSLTYKDVIIHFQKERSGGGEVESTMFPDIRDQSTVVVTFEDPATVDTAVDRTHSLDGHEVTVQRYPVPVVIPEVFEVVKARVNKSIFGSSGILQNVLEFLQGEYGVEYKRTNSSNSIYLIGSLQEIILCHDYIIQRITTQHQNAAARPVAVVQAFGTSSGVSNTTQTFTRGEDIKEVVYQTTPIILKFICTVPKYKRQLEQIEKDNNVQIRGNEDSTKVIIKPLPSCTKKKYEDGCDKYIDLYQKLFQGTMWSKDVVLIPGPGCDYITAQRAIDEIQPSAPVIIEQTTAQDTWLFYGEEKQVKKTVKDVCKLLNIDHPFKRAARRHIDDTDRGGMDGAAHSNLETDKRESLPEATSPDDKHSPASMYDGLKEEFVTKKGFKLSVRRSDITEEQVDVIVNCNDEFLTRFSSGLPKAIVDKGGIEISLDVEAQTKRRKVKPGEIIVSKGGRLDCSKVMHIITWNIKKNKEVQKNMVQDTCLDCLRKTQSKNMRSIAFPAVGAGPKIGMPLQICATAMLNGIEKYMATNDPRQNAVADIRFVHLDPAAFEVFKEELKRRYGDCRLKQEERNKRETAASGAHDLGTSSRQDRHQEHSSVGKSKETEKDVCAICLDNFTDPISLQKCKHQFCRDCIDQAFKHKKKCPTCGMAYGAQTGNMPRGTMHDRTSSYRHLLGHEHYGTIEINYYFPSGTQGPEHPNPGQSYSGTSRTAYLPDNPEGREVLRLLRKAFDARLTFTIGTSVTTRAQNTVTWNDIHHKTNIYGGATGFGYPDPSYLKRVKEELAAKGIS